MFHKKLLVFGSVLIALQSAHASCVCRCVAGEVKPICTQAIDMPPICAPAICPASPAVLPSNRIPAFGSESCSRQSVFDPRTGRYETKTICQ